MSPSEIPVVIHGTFANKLKSICKLRSYYHFLKKKEKIFKMDNILKLFLKNF